MRTALRAVLPLALAASLAAAEIVLPGDDFSPGWKRDGKPAVFIRADLFNHIDGGADLFLEFGFERVTVQRYVRAGTEIAAEVYEMSGPESALGVYLMKCGRETALPEIPARNSSETAQFTILKGRYFVQVDNFSEDKAAVPAMIQLSRAILDQVKDEKADPGLAALLPREGKIQGSERLIRGPVALQPFFTFGEGDIFVQGGKIFGMLAEYSDDAGGKFFRFAAAYPSAAAARETFLGLKANLDPYLKIVEAKDETFVFEDFKGRFGLVRVSGAKLEALFNLASRPKIFL